jgi:hypothetical protein
MSNYIADNISEIKSKIGNVGLVAVSKTHDIGKIRNALEAGQRIFGENRVQEAESKFPELRKDYKDIELHLIGPLQTNKVKEALALFDVIQTLDREKLANEIAKLTKQPNNYRTKQLFIQVNIGEEEQKAGIAPQQTAEFYKFCTEELKLPVIGLMCIPPVDEPAFMYFALLKNIAKQIDPKLKLSMGMSGDYEQAVEMGADYVRIGSAIFGERNYN